MSRLRNLGVDEAGKSRGVKKQKYPLDDYLMNENNLVSVKTTLLSPMSPVSSPETLDVLENAERLVKKAQEQMIEVSLNSVLNNFEEDPESFIRRRNLDDGLLHVCEIVESKFKESNDPHKIYGQKASTSRLPDSNRNLRQEKFPVKDSIGTLNKPLEISAHSSEFSANRVPEKFSFFKKESDWLKIEPPKYLNVFPTSAFQDTKSKNENSPTTRRCTMTNTGVIEFNGTDNPHGTIRIQTGPNLDIRSGLTVQKIESVHISPDPSSVPLYNNIATYCFRHEPSTSSNFDDSNRSRFEKQASVSTGARNVYDTEKEKHIRSTDYNETVKVDRIEEKSDPGIAVVKDFSHLSRHVEQNTDDLHEIPINRSNNDKNEDENLIGNQADSNGSKNGTNINLTSNVSQRMNLGIKSMNDDAKLRERKASSGSERSGEGKGGLKKSVSINLTPVRNSVDNNLEGGSANEDESPSHDFYGITSKQGSGSFPDEDKFYHVKSDKDYVPREKVCGEQFETGSCSRKCERDVEHKKKEKLKAALEAIANIEKIRYDIKDSGVVPPGCTQISEENNQCLADVVNLEFGELSDPERFKKALENLCKLGQKDRASTANTNSGIFQGAIDAFVKNFFDTNSRLKSSTLNPEIEDSLDPRRKNESRKNYPPTVKTRLEMKNKELTKASKQAKLGLEQKEVEHRRGASTTIKSKINNSDVNKLSTVPRTARDLTSRQFRTAGQRKEADVCTEPTVNQPGWLSKKMIEEDEEEVSSSSKEGEDRLVEDLDLTQPCVSEVDKVLKTYRESMSAICQGTEKLSQLISHHIMKNTLSNLKKKISPPSVSLCCNPVENDQHLNSVPCVSKKTLGETCYDQKKLGLSSIPRFNEHPSRRSDDAKLSEENNSPTDSRGPSEGTRTLSSEKETSNTQQFGAMNRLTNPRATNKTYQQTPANIKPQSLPPKYRAAKNQFMDIQYCVTEKSARVPILIEAGSNKVDNCGSKDSVKIPLCTYFNVENGCGKNGRSHRHSNYDIHSDQTADLGLYDMPLLISGFRDDASNNDRNDKMTVENNSVPQTKETELRIFGQIIDAVKNSSQFMKWFVVSLFNGIEIDSVNDVVRNLEGAAVHPIIIEQFLVILRERYRERSSLGGSIMTTNPLPGFDDLQEERDRDETAGLTKINEDLDNLKKSIRFSIGGKTTNARFDGEVENSAIGANNLELAEPETNSESMTSKDYAENKLQSELVRSKIIPDKKVLEKKDSTNCQEILVTFGQDFENRSDKSRSSLKCLSKNLQTSNSTSGEPPIQVGKKAERNEERNEERAEDGTEICQNNHSTAKKQNNLNERWKNSMLINVDSKKNCNNSSSSSSSNTDKDISFILPCDDVEINKKHVDLFDEEKSIAITLENETDGKIVGFQKESSFQNSLQINSSLQEKNTKINFNSNSDGQSSIAIGKSDGKLNIPDSSALTINLTENLRRNDGSNKCYCKAFDDDKTPKIDFRHVPCQSSLDAVNGLLKSRIQSDYNPRTSIDSNENSVRSSPDRITLLNKNAIDKRSKPSKLSTISKSNAKNVADLSKDGNKGKKKYSKNVGEDRDKKSSEDCKRGPMKCFRNRRESSGSEKSDGETGCSQLCMKVDGKCSCLDRVNRMTNFRGRKKVAEKNPTGREKLMGKSVTSPRQFNSPKRSGGNAAKHFSPKEPRLTSPKEGKNAALTKAKTKSSGNSNSNNNITQQKKKKTLQDAASHPVSLQTKDKSQNTAKTLTDSKNTETENIADSEGVIAYDELEKIFGEKVTSKDEINMQPSSKKFAEVEGIEFGVKPSVKQGSIDLAKNTCCGKIDRISERIMKSSGTADSVKMQESQTSEMGDDHQKYEPNNALESIPEIETPAVSKMKFEYKNIEEDSIIVLQPLNEVDHTFFIAKPNPVERKIIEEKLKKNLKIKENEGIDQNSSSVRESNERNVIPSRKVTYSNYEIHEHVDPPIDEEATRKSTVQLNRATSPNNFVEQKICQVDCVGGRKIDDMPSNERSNAVFSSISKTDSDVSFFEEKVECTNFCTNDGECSRMCSKLPGGSDYWEFPCRQDCPNEEVCIILCAPKPQLEQSVQTNSIDINEILERFTAEDNVPNLKLQIMKAILQELNKFEGIVETANEELKTIPERSESRNNRDNIEMENERELVEAGHKPRCHAEITGRRSVQYDEPQERLSHIMQNRKSLILPNVVRGIADMHPSTTLERLKLRSADPLVSGNFNKPESDKRYAVFNQSDPESSTINLNDPRVREHLASVAQIATRHGSERNQSNNPKNNVQQNATKIIEKTQTADKSNDKHSSKLNKNRRGMDADFSPRGERNCGGSIEPENSVKSFKSSDLEPGEFLEVRTPFDKPSKSYQSGKQWSTITENIQLSKEKVYCHGFCNNNRNYSDTKSRCTNVPEATETRNELSAHHSELDENFEANNSGSMMSNDVNSEMVNVPNSEAVKSRIFTTMNLRSDNKNLAKSLEVNNNLNLKEANDASGRFNDNPEVEQLPKHSDLRRPQIIDYFLGKTKLDKIKVNYENNRSEAIRTNRRTDNCRQLYMKFNFTSKATSELDNGDEIADSQDISAIDDNAVQLFTPRIRCDETIFTSFNRTGSKNWEQTSSDTYSEGEINFPSSCSYSLGEVKVSTAGTTAGKSFQDPDGLTVYVTESILDSTLVTGNSPGEILAEINETESNFSSSTS